MDVKQKEKPSLEGLAKNTLYDVLNDYEKKLLGQLHKKYKFTHQEIRRLVEIILDLSAWDDEDFKTISVDCENNLGAKDQFLKKIYDIYNNKKSSLRVYNKNTKKTGLDQTDPKVVFLDGKETIYGDCPACSKKTICCQLKTMDPVINCGFGCSYCCIQTFSNPDNTIYFHKNIKACLDKIKLDPEKLVHIGTGQASDSLMWENKYGALSELFAFADKWPNAIIELKTKSKNISYLLEHKVPKNVFCSWSVNPQAVIENEEHLTASLSARINAAKELTANGIKVGIHVHPVIMYEGWEKGFKDMAELITKTLDPKDVLFISFGTLHFIKPVLKQIRTSRIKTRSLQMPFVKNPEGKYTYPEEIKKEMFKCLYECFSSWHNKVFFYLCMESKEQWNATFGKCYNSNDEFESDFLKMISSKMDVV